MDAEMINTSTVPSSLTFDQILEDLTAIPRSGDDALTNANPLRPRLDADAADSAKNEFDADSNDLYEKIKHLVLFKTKMNDDDDGDEDGSEPSIDEDKNLSEINRLESRLESLKHYIELSKKFLTFKNSNK